MRRNGAAEVNREAEVSREPVHTCSKCGGRISKPQVEPDFKPYIVTYRTRTQTGAFIACETVVYAVDETHARDIAPQLAEPGTGNGQMLQIYSVARFPGT